MTKTKPEILPFCLIGLAALAPLAWCCRSFRDIWWFGDEWDQLDQIARQGLARWILQPFGENLVPLFKAAWGGMVFASGGNYFPMLLAGWLTHAINTALLGRVLRGAGFGWPGVLLASFSFAWTVANVEVLAWSVQWSNALTILFLLLGLDLIVRRSGDGSAWRSRDTLLLAISAAASALTFVRGVLTGIVFAVGVLASRRRERGAATLCLGIAIAAIGWTAIAAPGSHHAMAQPGFWPSSLEFAAWYWAAVPFHRLLEVGPWNGVTTAALAVLKVALVVWSLRHAREPQRMLLALCLLFDLGNAGLLGIGRHHTGLAMANSSRYYYSSLVCVLPFLALSFEAALAKLPSRPRMIAATLIIVMVAGAIARQWPREAEAFANGRGRNTRAILLRDPAPPAEGAVPGIPFLSTARAKELIAAYHLH